MPVAPAARAWPNSRPMRRHSGGAFFPAASAPPCILHWAAVVHGTLLSRRSPAKRIDSEGARAHAFDTADSCFWSSFPQIVTKGMPPKRRSPEQLDAAARGRATQAASKARRVACSSTAENGACFCGAVPPILDPPSLILIADPRRRPRRRHPSHLHPFASAPRQQPASRGHAARDVPGHEVSCLRLPLQRGRGRLCDVRCLPRRRRRHHRPSPPPSPSPTPRRHLRRRSDATAVAAAVVVARASVSCCMCGRHEYRQAPGL